MRFEVLNELTNFLDKKPEITFSTKRLEEELMAPAFL